MKYRRLLCISFLRCTKKHSSRRQTYGGISCRVPAARYRSPHYRLLPLMVGRFACLLPLIPPSPIHMRCMDVTRTLFENMVRVCTWPLSDSWTTPLNVPHTGTSDHSLDGGPVTRGKHQRKTRIGPGTRFRERNSFY